MFYYFKEGKPKNGLAFGLLLIMMLACSWTHAVAERPQQTVSGRVEDRQGQPLAGATVRVVGSNFAAATDDAGRFSITANRGDVLEFTYVGFDPTTVTVTNQREIFVQLQETAPSILEDVIVVGYGTQKITNISGAISTVKQEDIERLRPTRAEEALQGRAAGVNVIQGGSPGSKPTVLVRGIPSFSGTDPVVIVDGVPQTLDDLNSISASDIESINVLKDAATTAIYGVKGGNGVIVVTTKNGRKHQPTQITLNTNIGFQEAVKKINMLNASEYAAMVNEGSVAAGGGLIFPDLSTLGAGTDWQNEVFERPLEHSYNLSASGGGERLTYFLSGALLSQGGVVGGAGKSRFDRGNVTANMTYDITDRVKFILNNTYVMLGSRGIQENSFNSILGSALNFDPTVPVFNDNPDVVGKYGYSSLLLSEVFNPLTKLDNTYNRNRGNKLYGKAEVQVGILDNLTFSSRFGYTRYDDNGKEFTPLVFYGVNNVDNTMNPDGSTVTGRHNRVSHNKNEYTSFTFENFLNYDFNIQNDHNFETVLGMSISKSTSNGLSASRQDVPFNSWEFADFSAATGQITENTLDAIGGGYWQSFRKNLSYFGRVNYDYQSRYLASLSVRRDGSYAFGSENKFGNFYSGSLGWVVSNEDFYDSAFFNYLKIRGSAGSIGNENVNPQFVQIITGGPSYDPSANSNGYNFGGVFYPGSTVGSIANNALRWERQIQYNIGFDVNFWNNRFTLNADYFYKNVDGLLFTPSASLYLGTVPLPTANVGSTETKGLDLTLAFQDNFSEHFRFNTALTVTTAKNLVTKTNEDGTARLIGGSYFNGQSQTVTVFEKGETPGYFYGYRTDGLFQSGEDIANWASQSGAQPGDIRFVDTDGNGEINADDQVKIGDPFPDLTLGLNLGFSYKKFDFGMFLYSSIGNDIYRAYERNANYTNKPNSILNRWIGPHSTDDARYPRYSFTDPNNNSRVSDRYVEDGSFLKVKNLQVGYTLSGSFLKNAVKELRIYGQVKNAWTLTNYLGYDPEIPGGILETGIDRGAYPQARVYSLGVNFKL